MNETPEYDEDLAYEMMREECCDRFEDHFKEFVQTMYEGGAGQYFEGSYNRIYSALHFLSSNLKERKNTQPKQVTR